MSCVPWSHSSQAIIAVVGKADSYYLTTPKSGGTLFQHQERRVKAAPCRSNLELENVLEGEANVSSEDLMQVAIVLRSMTSESPRNLISFLAHLSRHRSNDFLGKGTR